MFGRAALPSVHVLQQLNKSSLFEGAVLGGLQQQNLRHSRQRQQRTRSLFAGFGVDSGPDVFVVAFTEIA